MKFDVMLPIVMFLLASFSSFLYGLFKEKVKVLFEDRKFSTRDAVFLVLLMGILITVIAYFPGWTIQILFLVSYSFILFSFTYIALKKWYYAVFTPIIFVLFYFFYWNIFSFNFFAFLFSIIVTVYLGNLFSWKTTWIFTILLTIMDIIQVFITGFMGESATKMLGLGLPVAIVLPMYPVGNFISLGLGDIFLTGILTIQTGLKKGLKNGILTTLFISLSMFVFEIVSLNTDFINFFPATVVVMVGWIASMGAARIFQI